MNEKLRMVYTKTGCFGAGGEVSDPGHEYVPWGQPQMFDREQEGTGDAYVILIQAWRRRDDKIAEAARTKAGAAKGAKAAKAAEARAEAERPSWGE